MKQTDKHITALIDGEPVKVARGLTILEAARRAGIYIPTLCYLEKLKPYGGCRLCIVEVKGGKGYPTACTTPLEPGMEVLTKTAKLQSLRRSILEMTLSEHPYTCLVCSDKKECGEFMHTTRKAGTITGCNFCTSNGDCELQDLIDYLDLKDVRYPIAYRGIPPVKTNPFYDLDYNLCVLCGRCVRICNEERNSGVLAFVQRGNATLVGTAFGESQADAGCEFCGACVDVCPTGSISGKLGKWAGPPDRSVETTCTLCSVGCTMNVNSRAGKLVGVGPPPGKRTEPLQLCIRGKFLAGDLTGHPDRLTAPLIRRNGRVVEVSWKEAIEFTADKLVGYKGNGFGLIGSAQDTLEENYSLQKFAGLAMNSDRVELPEGLVPLLPPPGNLDDIYGADTILLIGTNASLTHPLVENRVRKAFNTGRKVLYANSIPTRTSPFTSREIHYSKGKGFVFLRILLAELAKQTISGLPAGFAEKLSEPIPDKALKDCTVKEDELKAFVTDLAKSSRLFIVVGEPFLYDELRPETIKAIENIQFLKGKKCKCNALLLRNEGMPGGNRLLPSIGRDGIRAMMIAGDVPASGKLKKLKFLVQLNMFRTGLSEYADAILPVTGFLENEGHFLTADRKVKRLRRALKPAGDSRPIPVVISSLATAMGVDGFTVKRASDVWKEMEAGIKLPGQPGRPDLKYRSLEPLSGLPGQKGGALSELYYYRGNSLAALIPDLQKVIEYY